MLSLAPGQRRFRMSVNMVSYLQSEKKKKQKGEKPEAETNDIDDVLANISGDVILTLDDNVLRSLSLNDHTSVDESTHDHSRNIELDETEENMLTEDTILTLSQEITIMTDHEQDEILPPNMGNSERDQNMSNSNQDCVTKDASVHNVINNDSLKRILLALQSNLKWASKWGNKTQDQFKEIMMSKSLTMSSLTKAELLFIMDYFNDTEDSTCLKIGKSWSKTKIVDRIHQAITSTSIKSQVTKRRIKRNPSSLTVLCRKVVKALPKAVLNASIAEYEFVDHLVS